MLFSSPYHNFNLCFHGNSMKGSCTENNLWAPSRASMTVPSCFCQFLVNLISSGDSCTRSYRLVWVLEIRMEKACWLSYIWFMSVREMKWGFNTEFCFGVFYWNVRPAKSRVCVETSKRMTWLKYSVLFKNQTLFWIIDVLDVNIYKHNCVKDGNNFTVPLLFIICL